MSDLAAWLAKWSGKYAKLTGWVEENIDETLTFYRLPRQHHKHLKSTNMLERLNEEIKRRTHVVRIFPNAESCLRLVRALAVETHENWLEQHRYLNMDDQRLFWARTGNNRAKTQHFRHFWMSISRLSIARARARERQVFRARAESPSARRRDKRADRPFAKIKELFTKIMRLS